MRGEVKDTAEVSGLEAKKDDGAINCMVGGGEIQRNW